MVGCVAHRYYNVKVLEGCLIKGRVYSEWLDLMLIMRNIIESHHYKPVQE